MFSYEKYIVYDTKSINEKILFTKHIINSFFYGFSGAQNFGSPTPSPQKGSVHIDIL